MADYEEASANVVNEEKLWKGRQQAQFPQNYLPAADQL
jgi:hypothetical protein